VRGRAVTDGGGWCRSGGGGDRLERCVDDDGVESGRDLESFGMKSEMTRGGLLFICLKISAAVLN
jgi:hypothetical protein